MGVRLNALAWASMTTARPEKDRSVDLLYVSECCAFLIGPDAGLQSAHRDVGQN
jgi:hypothetical protein